MGAWVGGRIKVPACDAWVSKAKYQPLDYWLSLSNSDKKQKSS
jgi:hypothetical protein